MKYTLCFCLVVGLGACVAPEPPPVVRNTAPAAAPVASSGTYEDAPLPNRKMGKQPNDSIIRMAK